MIGSSGHHIGSEDTVAPFSSPATLLALWQAGAKGPEPLTGSGTKRPSGNRMGVVSLKVWQYANIPRLNAVQRRDSGWLCRGWFG